MRGLNNHERGCYRHSSIKKPEFKMVFLWQPPICGCLFAACVNKIPPVFLLVLLAFDFLGIICFFSCVSNMNQTNSAIFVIFRCQTYYKNIPSAESDIIQPVHLIVGAFYRDIEITVKPIDLTEITCNLNCWD